MKKYLFTIANIVHFTLGNTRETEVRNKSQTLLSSVWCTCIHCKHWQPINNLKLLLSDSTKVQEDTLHLLIKSLEKYRRLLDSLKLSRLAVHQYSLIQISILRSDSVALLGPNMIYLSEKVLLQAATNKLRCTISHRQQIVLIVSFILSFIVVSLFQT